MYSVLIAALTAITLQPCKSDMKTSQFITSVWVYLGNNTRYRQRYCSTLTGSDIQAVKQHCCIQSP